MGVLAIGFDLFAGSHVSFLFVIDSRLEIATRPGRRVMEEDESSVDNIGLRVGM